MKYFFFIFILISCSKRDSELNYELDQTLPVEIKCTISKLDNYFVYLHQFPNQPAEYKVLGLFHNEFGKDFWVRITQSISNTLVLDEKQLSLDYKIQDFVSDTVATRFLAEIGKYYRFNFSGVRSLGEDCLEIRKTGEPLTEKIGEHFVYLNIHSDTSNCAIRYFSSKDRLYKCETEQITFDALSIEKVFETSWINKLAIIDTKPSKD